MLKVYFTKRYLKILSAKCPPCVLVSRCNSMGNVEEELGINSVYDSFPDIHSNSMGATKTQQTAWHKFSSTVKASPQSYTVVNWQYIVWWMSSVSITYIDIFVYISIQNMLYFCILFSVNWVWQTLPDRKIMLGSHWNMPQTLYWEKAYDITSANSWEVTHIMVSANIVFQQLRSLSIISSLPGQNGRHFWQTKFSNAFSWMKVIQFWFKFHWNLFPGIQLTINQNWFR